MKFGIQNRENKIEVLSDFMKFGTTNKWNIPIDVCYPDPGQI